MGVALAGAVVLAGGAYALGAQKDDGSAVANGPGRMGYGYGGGPPGGPGGPGGPRGAFMEQRLEEFATKLGVTPAKLRAALEAVRPDRGQRDEKRDELASALATALGLEKSKVEAALEKARPAGRRFRGGPGGPPPGDPGNRPPRPRRGKDGPPVAALAKELGVTPAKLRTALQDIRQKKRDAFAQKLADELGIPVAKVKSALPDKPGP